MSTKNTKSNQVISAPISDNFPNRITMSQFVKHMYNGMLKAGIDPDDVYVLSIGTGTRTIDGVHGWYYLINYSEMADDPIGKNILIPMYDEGEN